jgi:Tfp pilus assembly protein PilN
MIKINLVPIKEKKKRKELLAFICIALVFAVLVLAMVWIYGKRLAVKNDLKKQIELVKEESKSYEEKIAEVKDLQNKEASLEAFKKTVKSITETQRKVVVAIDQLALILPDGVWFTGMTQGKGADANKFTVQGYAFTRLNLQDYFNALRKPNKFLKDVTFDIKNVSAAVGNNKQIHQFEISAKVADPIL